MVEYMVKANLRTLLSCLHCIEFRVYIKAFDWLTLLAQLQNTGIPAIQLATKILSCYLSSSNPKLLIKCSDNDIHQIFEVTAKAAGSSYKLNEFTFHSLDMILFLQKFIEQEKSEALIPPQASVLPVMTRVISNGTLEEKIAISLFVWKFLSKCNVCAYSGLMQVFEDCEESELKDITKSMSAFCSQKDCAGDALDIQSCFNYCPYNNIMAVCCSLVGTPNQSLAPA